MKKTTITNEGVLVYYLVKADAMNKVVFKDGHTEDILYFLTNNDIAYTIVRFVTETGIYEYRETITPYKENELQHKERVFLELSGIVRYASGFNHPTFKVIDTIDHIELKKEKKVMEEATEKTIDSKKGECGSMTGEREETYLDIQRRVAGIFYTCAAFNDIEDDYIHKFYEDIHDCVKKAWQLGIHQERMRQVQSEIKKGGNE